MSRVGGGLNCPKCHKNGMSDYEHWESKEMFNNQKYYIFYKKKEERVWIYWTLLFYFNCVKKIDRCWDPCNCFRDYCTNGNCNSSNDNICVCLFKFCLIILLFELIFLFYFFFCIWFDIYNFIFTKKKTRIVCNGNTFVEIDEKENMWNSNKIIYLTETQWIANYRYLFKCNKCDHSSDTFIDFTEYTVNAEINNNTNNNLNTTVGDINLNGQAITVHFVTDDGNKINIQSYSSSLFSQVMNDLFIKIPEYKNKCCSFFYNDIDMNPDLTMEQNHYISGETIICRKGIN
mgnify:FL=1